ncbi:MAG: histidine-type phosphatase [Muribaculaceae bacterium]|nr:histidine-type phosphatase [Muribaculaceae bacterium]
MKPENLKRLFLSFGLASMMALPAVANTRTLADVTTHQAGGNYYCYPYLYETPPAQTPAPEGYEPFHMEHYGRHGSRWHIGYKLFDKSYEILDKAKSAGKLTPLGEKTYEAIKTIREKAHEGRSGELSDKGAWQHQGIGKRMVENYPQIFNSKTNLDARSTVVIRSILSMFNALDGIRSMVPDMKIKTDASYADMWYMNYSDKEARKLRQRADSTVVKEFNRRHADKGEYLKKLINDPVYAKDSIGNKLYHSLLTALLNCQSHSDQPWLVDEIFTPEEVKERWVQKNVYWLMQGGNSKITENRMPFSQSNLLENIILSADTAMNSTVPSVNLRYGHDTIVMPLTALMELDNFGDEMNDLEALADSGWHDYLVVPMAANIQMVFYRKPGTTGDDDVLVKVLLNERETKLPAGHVSGPYYRWKDLRDYYMKKIAPYTTGPVLQYEN